MKCEEYFSLNSHLFEKLIAFSCKQISKSSIKLKRGVFFRTKFQIIENRFFFETQTKEKAFIIVGEINRFDNIKEKGGGLEMKRNQADRDSKIN